ncbi:MAG: DDE-type integrase/transposase/recombinase [Rhabdochlamydiaceae bacterium]
MVSKTNPRQEKGKEIAEKPDQIKRIDDNWYQVKSQSLSYDSWYDVILTEKDIVCDCPDHQQRKVKCKHIHAVEFSLKIREQVKEKNEIVINPVNIDSCIYCSSKNPTKDGLRHNKYGNIQKFQCKDCKKYFTINIGFEKMKHDPKGITMAMQLYFSGESLRNVAKALKLLGVDVSYQTVYNWNKKYMALMNEYVKKIQPQVGDKWRADELFVKIRGNMKYLYALLDDETRFWIAQQVSNNKFKDDVSQMLREGKELTGKKPSIFITDGAKNFHQAYTKEFWTQLNPRTKHIQHIHFKKDMNNNKMERFNGELRDREKVVRGVKKEDSPLILGSQIYHNYFRPHMGLDGKTPSEACGIKIEGDNKWITLIQNASRREV